MTTTASTPPPNNSFAGGSKTHRATASDQVALVGAGVTMHECLAAADDLEKTGVRVRVIDANSIKPIDRDTLIEACRITGSRLVIAEDHYREGGLGAAVFEALADTEVPALHVAHLAVRDLRGSGTPAELLDTAGISASHIVRSCTQSGRVMTPATRETSMKPTRGRTQPVAGRRHRRTAGPRHTRQTQQSSFAQSR